MAFHIEALEKIREMCDEVIGSDNLKVSQDTLQNIFEYIEDVLVDNHTQIHVYDHSD